MFRPGPRSDPGGMEDTVPLLGDPPATDHPPPSPVTRDSTTIHVPSSVGGHQHHHSDFVFIKIVARLTLQLVRKFWAFSSAAVLAFVLFYWLCGGIVAFAMVTFAVSGLLYNATDRFLYHPDQPPTSRVYVPSPSTFGLPFENLYIRSKDSTRIHMFYVKSPKVTPDQASKLPTILFLHGNAGNVGHRLANVHGLVKHLDCNVCLLEYRGYGHSDGSPSEEGLYLDAQAALEYLTSRPDIDSSKIFVFGRSLGGAVAIDLCSRAENRDRVACLILENTFTSIPDVAKVLFNFRVVRWIPKCFYKNQFLSRSKVCKISTPVLFLSGAADALIPSAMMSELFRACGSENKRLARFPEGTHNETWLCPQYYQTVLYFLEEVVFRSLPLDARINPPPLLINSTDHSVI